MILDLSSINMKNHRYYSAGFYANGKGLHDNEKELSLDFHESHTAEMYVTPSLIYYVTL